MRWVASVEDRLHRVELSRGPCGAVDATVDGRRYALSVTEPQPGVYSILLDGASHEVHVRPRRGRCRVRVGAAVFDVVPGEAARADLAGSGARASGRHVVGAVMPGRVLRVLVAPGQAVEARQGLVVLEAMKMENELTSPRAGVVREVRVEPGATVETGDPLIVIE